MSDGLGDDLFQIFLNWLYTSEGISVPTDFHSRCALIEELKGNDITGVVNSITDYQVSAASNTQYMIECNDSTLQEILNTWLSQINENIQGIPTGLQELSKEYFKERWQGSSFCILRGKGWKKIKIGDTSIEVPTTFYFVNGASIYVKRPTGSYKLGSDKFFLDKSMKEEPVPEGVSEIAVIQKPFNRWQDQYPSPYLVRKGIVKNYLGMKTLQEKSDEVISKILPYLFIVKKGSEALRRVGVKYTDDDYKEIADGLKGELEKFKNMKKKTPINVTGEDTDYSHLIPDLRNVVSEELYRQGYRATLAGLGVIELIPITGQSRQQSMLNPQVLIEETNDGVAGFKSMLMDVISIIKERNKIDHKKLFSEKKKLMIYNTPLKINVEQILDAIRSGFDRGGVSIETYLGTLGFNIDIEREKRKKEYEDGDEGIFYPHLIQNVEEKDERVYPSQPRNKEKLEDQNKKKGTPESKNFKNAELEEDLIIAPYTKENHPKYLDKYPQPAIDLWIKVFNESLPKGEEYAFPVAWSTMKRFLKRHYKKVGDKWIKKGEQE